MNKNEGLTPASDKIAKREDLSASENVSNIESAREEILNKLIQLFNKIADEQKARGQKPPYVFGQEIIEAVNKPGETKVIARLNFLFREHGRRCPLLLSLARNNPAEGELDVMYQMKVNESTIITFTEEESLRVFRSVSIENPAGALLLLIELTQESILKYNNYIENTSPQYYSANLTNVTKQKQFLEKFLHGLEELKQKSLGSTKQELPLLFE